MNGLKNVPRRQFIASAAGVSAAGVTSYAAPLKESIGNRGMLRVGMVGFGPYSHAAVYMKALNDPAYPPRTNMRVTAIWGRPDRYAASFRGTDEWRRKRVDELSASMNPNNLPGGIQVVATPEAMVSLVDAAFITDPEDALNLARPFLRAGKPVFLNRPFAWTLAEARGIISLAKANNTVVVGGSCIPWMGEFQTAASRIDPAKLQHYYADGSTANFVSYMPHILETVLKLTGGKVLSCATHGVSWPPDEDPLAIPPVMTHLIHEPMAQNTHPVIGVASTWYGAPNRNWVRMHQQSEVIEQGVVWEGNRTGFTVLDEHLWLPLLRVIGQSFSTGFWPETEEELLEKVRVMLMVHKSGVEGGRTVLRGEVENHELPRYQTEKA